MRNIIVGVETPTYKLNLSDKKIQNLISQCESHIQKNSNTIFDKIRKAFKHFVLFLILLISMNTTSANTIDFNDSNIIKYDKVFHKYLNNKKHEVIKDTVVTNHLDYASKEYRGDSWDISGYSTIDKPMLDHPGYKYLKYNFKNGNEYITSVSIMNNTEGIFDKSNKLVGHIDSKLLKNNENEFLQVFYVYDYTLENDVKIYAKAKLDEIIFLLKNKKNNEYVEYIYDENNNLQYCNINNISNSNSDMNVLDLSTYKLLDRFEIKYNEINKAEIVKFWLNPLTFFVILFLIAIIPTIILDKYYPKYDDLIKKIPFWFYIVSTGILGYLFLCCLIDCSLVGGGSGIFVLIYVIIALLIHFLVILPITSCLCPIKPLNISNNILKKLLKNISVALISINILVFISVLIIFLQ